VSIKNLAAGIAAATLALAGPCARADLQTTLQAVGGHQVGVSGVVSLGTVVTARTNIRGIWAKAGYRLECDDYRVRPALSGSRGWSDYRLIGPVSIVVTAPEWVPAEMALPGWLSVPTGTFVTCLFTYSGEARTSLVPIGAGGTSIPLGGDSWEASASHTIAVIKTGPFPGEGCLQ
jgi:hypothetical protein